MIRTPWKAFVPAALLVASSAYASGTEPAQRPASQDDYKLVVTRNIFVRERGSRRADDASQRTPAPASRPERYIALRGIVSEGAEFVAFLEDVRTGATSVLRTGDAIASARLSTITRDYIECESDDGTRRVEVGQTLEGEASSPVALHELTEALGSAGPPSAETSSGATSVAEDAAVLERLRQRRQSETRQ